MEALAKANLEKNLKSNKYPGRGIVIGKNDAGQWIQVYWIMGRSENSRNRIFAVESDILRTQAADPGKVKDPSLIIYNAMRHTGSFFIVTNGVQTDAICEGMAQGQPFPQTLLSQMHEPDAPNHTPRISGCVDIDASAVWLSAIKASPFSPDSSGHNFFRYSNIQAGFGYTITTYKSDGNPIPSFEGEPYVVPLAGSATDIANTYWDVLDSENKISLAVRSIDSATNKTDIVVLNKYKAV